MPARRRLRKWQAAVRDARAAVLTELDTRIQGRSSYRAAASALLAQVGMASAEEPLAAIVTAANARRGVSRRASLRTLQRWLKSRAKGGVAALVPKVGTATFPSCPSWSARLVELYSLPGCPSVAWCVRRIHGEVGSEGFAPSYDQAKRLLRTLHHTQGSPDRSRSAAPTPSNFTLLERQFDWFMTKYSHFLPCRHDGARSV